jgi:hypothetical protein
MKHGPAANETHLLLFLRTTSERLLVLEGHFHPKLLTATDVVRFLVFFLFLVKGSIWLVFGHTPSILLEHER